MIEVRNEVHVTLWLTPNDLRRMADEMEERWAKVRLGGSAETHVLHGNGTVVHVVVDQDRINRK